MNKLLKYSFLWLFMLMGVVSANAQDETLTVYDGGNENSYIPFYGGCADGQEKVEFIIPTADILAMNGCTIKQMSFYNKTGSVNNWNNHQVKVFLKEVNTATVTEGSYFGDAGSTTVYEGYMNITSGELIFPFSTNYTYNGGNLLVGIYTISYANYGDLDFYGKNTTYNSAVIGLNNSYSPWSINYSSPHAEKFLPKTTFTYEAGSTPIVTVDAPTFDVAAGTVEAGTEVTITGNSDKLVYTTDGTIPSLDNGTVVNGTTATVTINESMTLMAIAVDAEDNKSSVTAATYTVIVPITKISQLMDNWLAAKNVEWIIKDDPSYKVRFVALSKDGTKVYLNDGARGIVLTDISGQFDGYAEGDVIKSGKLQVYFSEYEWYAPSLTGVLEPMVKGENIPVEPIEDNLSSWTEANRYTFITVNGTMITQWGSYYVNTTDNQIDTQWNFGVDENVDEEACVDKTGTFTLVRWSAYSLAAVTPDYFVADAPAAVAVEIGAAGAATFSSAEALDFTDVETVAAYIAKEATSGNSALEFTRVYKVPANTGLIVRNAAGEDDGAVSADVPVLAGEADNVDGNLFVAATEEIASLPSVDGEYTNYILNKKNGVLGFYKANGKKVAAGKAYLKMLTGSGAAEFIGFDGEVTAIESLTADKANNEIFDLQGRRVAKAAKGVYIVNGKKVVLK